MTAEAHSQPQHYENAPEPAVGGAELVSERGGRRDDASHDKSHAEIVEGRCRKLQLFVMDRCLRGSLMTDVSDVAGWDRLANEGPNFRILI